MEASNSGAAAVEEHALLEDLAGHHLLEGVELRLLAKPLEPLDDVVDLLPGGGVDEVAVLLLVDGLVQALSPGASGRRRPRRRPRPGRSPGPSCRCCAPDAARRGPCRTRCRRRGTRRNRSQRRPPRQPVRDAGDHAAGEVELGAADGPDVGDDLRRPEVERGRRRRRGPPPSTSGTPAGSTARAARTRPPSVEPQDSACPPS